MNVQDLMSPRGAVAAPGQTLQQAAQLMLDGNYGIVPVEDNARLVGVLTDRDMVVRAMAAGKSPNECKVSEIMTAEVFHVGAQDSLEEAEQLMSRNQVRRLPVVDGNQRLVGMISLGDIALEHPSSAGHTLQDVSKPLLNRASGFLSAD